MYLLTSVKNTHTLIVKVYMGIEWMERDFIGKKGMGVNLVETPPNKKPCRPADGFLKTAKTRVPSLKIGSEKDLE